MAKKTNQVTRKVTESRVIEIYKVTKDLAMTLLDTRTVSGRVGETELTKEFVAKEMLDKKAGDSLFIKTISENVVTYGMSTDEFMKHASIITDEGK